MNSNTDKEGFLSALEGSSAYSSEKTNEKGMLQHIL